MADRREELWKATRDASLAGSGAVAVGARQAIAGGGAAPPGFEGFVANVREHAYRVTDEELLAMKAAGKADDEIFEVAVSAALGAAEKRLRAALAAIRGGK
jgi:hypothetical protein